MPAASEVELTQLDAQIAEATEELKKTQDQIRSEESETKHLLAEPTDEGLAAELSALDKENCESEKKLEFLTNNQQLVDKDEKSKICKEHEEKVKVWRKRKRMCLDVTDAILESYPKNKKSLFQDVGIDTDEDAGIA